MEEPYPGHPPLRETQLSECSGFGQLAESTLKLRRFAGVSGSPANAAFAFAGVSESPQPKS
jgi:hypothetical protein